MTVLFTETHLTTNPTYIEGENAAFFSIALSSLTLQCHIHREENIAYLRENQIIQGDLVRLSGVFVTNINEPYFIKVHTLMLVPKAGIGKKRKFEDIPHLGGAIIHSEDTCDSSESEDTSSRRTSLMSISSTPTPETVRGVNEQQVLALGKNGIYREVDLSIKQLFFMLYGKAMFLTEQYSSFYRSIPHKNHAVLARDQAIRAKTGVLLTIFHQVYQTSQDLSSQIQIINFVSNVRTFMEKLNELKDLMPDGLMPPGITIGRSVPLPRHIYQSFHRQ